MSTRKELAAERRKQRHIAKARLAALRSELRDARRRRKQALMDAKERCRAERLAVSERLRANRIRVLAELRETGRAERQAVRAACVARRKEARSLGNDMARTRVQLAAERREQAELRKVARAVRGRLVALTSRQQTDEEVVAAIPPDLAQLFARVKDKIKGRGRVSRVEEFLRYAESHPAEVLAAQQHSADTRVQALERQERELAKEAKKAGRGRSERTIVIENPKDRDHTRFGQPRAGETLKDTTVTIVPGKRIEIVHLVRPGHRNVKNPVTGRYEPNAEAFTVRKTFEIGDLAEVGGYNLTYTGRVRSITPKGVTVVEHEGTSYAKTHRLSVYLFARMNWDFDAEETARRNAETSASM